MLWLALAVLAGGPSFFPPQLADPASWAAQPSWLSARAEAFGVQHTADGLRVWAKGRGRGMKFSAVLPQGISSEEFPWLVVRYRCRNYDPRVDYLVWLNDQGRRGGLYLVTPKYIKADGQWHTIAADLLALGCGEIRGVAVQVKSAGDQGEVVFAEIRFAALEPAGADTFIPGPRRTGKAVAVGPGGPQDWHAEPSWLGNPSAEARVEKTAVGVKFVVRGGGLGMKWSRVLPEAIPGGYLKMRYRARGINPRHDYALYAASEPGGKAPDEQYVVHLDELIADGQWHTAVAYCRVAKIKTLAVQVQVEHGADAAELEIASLQIGGPRPQVKLTEECDARAGWLGTEEMKRRGLKPLPPPTGTEKSEAQRLMGLAGWWPAKRITVAGVPFVVGDGAAGSGRSAIGEIVYGVGGRWRQLYLLLGARLPAREQPGYNPARPRLVTHPHRFVCELLYGDGFVEQQMPTCLSLARPGVRHGVAVYALAVDGRRRLEKLVLRDGHKRGAFVLYAVTAASKPGPADPAVAPQRAPKLKPRRRASDARRVIYEGAELRADSGALHLRLDLSGGVDLVSLTSDYLPDVPTLAWQGSIFSVRVGDVEARSSDIKVAGVEVSDDGRRATVTLDFEPMLPLVGRLTIATVQPDELWLGLELHPHGKLDAEPEVRFPLLLGCRTGAVADTWVFYPRRGTVISNKNQTWRWSPHSGVFPLQVMGIFNPRGGGFYVRTEYTSLFDRLYDLSKDSRGVHVAVRYPWWRGQKLNVVLGTNADDWHGQLAAYNRWRKSWFRPAAPRKEWFRRVFNFRQQFLTFAVPRKSGLFDPKAKVFHFDKVIEHDTKAFGGIDYLHLFDWGWSPSHGRCGDYAPWDYLGPVENFRREIKRLQDRGLPVGLYIEGRLVSPKSSMFKTAEPWQLIDSRGRPIRPFAPDYSICPFVRGWQEHLQAVYARVRRQTGALGYYIDEFGFARIACYGRGHGHPVPAYIGAGELELTRKVRQAVGPQCALYTEESPADVTMQYQDGSFTYAISSVSDDLSPHHVNITRFAVPDFKTIEIICCDKPLDENIEALRRILFNGEAIWLEGIPEDWFDPRALEFIRHMHQVMSSCADCFTSLSPEALVPTRWQGLYANRFPAAGGGRCVWTVYWTGPRTLRGEWLDVPHVRGAKYRELWAGRALNVRRRGARDIIGGTIHPHEVLVLLQERAD